MKFLNFLKKFNLTLILPTLFLTSLGLLSIYSSSISGGDFLNFKKQIIFFAFSIFLVILLNFFDLRLLKRNSYLVFGLYFLSLLFLFGLFFFGKELKGVKGWYNFGIFFFDPVPLSAIFLIIILSKYFSTRHIEIQRLQPIFFSALYAILPALLVLFQPNLGSSLILISAWLGIVIFSGLKLRHFFVLVLIFLLLFVFGWKFWLKDYQKQRILSFLNPKIDTQGISWNINQAKIAIGSGGFFGKGIGKGAQTQYGFLPASQTDFIFASLGEEIGFFGIFWFFLAFTFLFYRIIKLAFLAQDNFTRLFAAGFGFLILSQCLINIGMSLGLLPIIGIPLPFVSYGGSQLFGFYLGLGILMSLTKF